MQVAHRAALLAGLCIGRLCPVVRIDDGRISLAYRSAQLGIGGSAGHGRHPSFFHIHPARAQSSSGIEGRCVGRGFRCASQMRRSLLAQSGRENCSIYGE